jgi:hypothetical protein
MLFCVFILLLLLLCIQDHGALVEGPLSNLQTSMMSFPKVNNCVQYHIHISLFAHCIGATDVAIQHAVCTLVSTLQC